MRGLAWKFRAVRSGARAARCGDQFAGAHNVLNALAAIAVATEEGVSDGCLIIAGLRVFSGVGRRFDVADGVRFAGKQITVVDDYGHHPTEVAMVIEAARKGS